MKTFVWLQGNLRPKNREKKYADNRHNANVLAKHTPK